MAGQPANRHAARRAAASSTCPAPPLPGFGSVLERNIQALDKRSDLDLQIGLLAEHEVTELAALVAGIAARLWVRTAVDGELGEITQDVAPEAVLDEIEARQA